MHHSLRVLYIVLALVVGMVMYARNARAAEQIGTGRADVLIGIDDDNTNDPEIQPAGVAANQSMNNADVLIGRGGDDVIIGMLGSDTMIGDSGNDILIGGIERATQPNSDVQLGGSGNDTALWAGGDGSEMFDGGRGHQDALVFGTIDRDPTTNVPTLSPVTGRHHKTGLPTANVTGQAGFCTLEPVADPETRGFEFLVRFFSKANGNLLVTLRTHDVEQVFCTAQGASRVTFADLTDRYPAFVEVDLSDVQKLNADVAKMIR